MSHPALFPSLLGEHFDELDERVRAVHDGRSGRWQGTASVQRGSGWLLRLAATLAGLPGSVKRAAVTVDIEVRHDGELWTRQFGGSRRMRSTLFARGALLVERIGLVTLQFRIRPHARGIQWELRRLQLLGLPLPRGWFHVDARSESCPNGYRFVVGVCIVGVGDLIHYEGQLLVPHE